MGSPAQGPASLGTCHMSHTAPGSQPQEMGPSRSQARGHLVWVERADLGMGTHCACGQSASGPEQPDRHCLRLTVSFEDVDRERTTANLCAELGPMHHRPSPRFSILVPGSPHPHPHPPYPRPREAQHTFLTYVTGSMISVVSVTNHHGPGWVHTSSPTTHQDVGKNSEQHATHNKYVRTGPGRWACS